MHPFSKRYLKDWSSASTWRRYLRLSSELHPSREPFLFLYQMPKSSSLRAVRSWRHWRNHSGMACEEADCETGDWLRRCALRARQAAWTASCGQQQVGPAMQECHGPSSHRFLGMPLLPQAEQVGAAGEGPAIQWGCMLRQGPALCSGVSSQLHNDSKPAALLK